jgi:hypothetical protein
MTYQDLPGRRKILCNARPDHTLGQIEAELASTEGYSISVNAVGSAKHRPIQTLTRNDDSRELAQSWRCRLSLANPLVHPGSASYVRALPKDRVLPIKW